MITLSSHNVLGVIRVANMNSFVIHICELYLEKGYLCKLETFAHLQKLPVTDYVTFAAKIGQPYIQCFSFHQ